MYPFMAQQGAPAATFQGGSLATLQGGPVAGTQLPAPYTGYAAPAQIDFSQILNLLIPIMGLMLVFGMMMPMMRSMTEGFK